MPFVGIGVGIGRQRFAQGGIFAAYAARVAADGGTTEAGACVNAVSGISLDSSLLLVPSGYKSGVVYSQIPTSGDGDLTFTRASDATRVNSDGLIEKVRTNLAFYSEEFDNAYWSKPFGWTVTPNAVNSPNGTLTADEITPTNYNHINRSFTVSTNTTYAPSIYVKRNNTNYTWLTLIFSGGTSISYGYQINWTTFTISLIGGRTAAVSPTFESVGDGWYRISFGCASGNNTSASFQIIPDAQAGTNSIYLWGAQLETGDIATDYIPTTTTAVSVGMTANVPRLDYSQGSCPSLLLEPQRTNLLLRSEEFDNAAWTKEALSVTANDIDSPDGNQNADLLIANGSSGRKIIYTNLNTSGGQSYSLSIYAKKGTNNFIQVAGGFVSFGTNVFANFDLNTGGVGSVGSSTTASIQSVGDGWYRCTITGTGTTTTTSAAFLIAIVESSTSTRLESNSLSTSVYVWGAQIEQGAYPTSYIPTTSATVTRLADSFTRDNIYTNGLITSSGGTWFVEFKNNVALSADSSTAGFWLGTNNSTPSSNGTFYFRQGGGIQVSNLWAYIGGVGSQIYPISTADVKIAIKWNGTTADVFANGVKVVSSLSFNIVNMEFLSSGSGVGRPFFIQQMALYPTLLSDSDCISLTTL